MNVQGATDEITFEQSETATDFETLYQYVIQGIENNNDINGAKTSDWEDGQFACYVYLDHNTVVDDETLAEVADAVTKYIDAFR